MYCNNYKHDDGANFEVMSDNYQVVELYTSGRNTSLTGVINNL
jgi:hypothetical protein